MASKVKVSRLESEIEKCRVEGEWNKVSELVKQLSSKNPGLDYYTHFIIGESMLEVYGRETTGIEQNMATAKTKLSEAERHLKLVLKENGKMTLEASLLLGKLYYYEGSYQSALNVFENAHLENISIATSSARLVHIIAESYAVKGLCLEQLSTSTTSKFKAAEKEEKILKCFELAGDLALLCLQERDKTVQAAGNLGSSLNIGTMTQPETGSPIGLLETAIQQSPIYYIKRGDVDKGIKRFRDLLRAVESRFTQGLRLTLARQLAEVLLRGVCESNYQPPDPAEIIKVEKQNDFKPRKYTADGLFIPKHDSEEALLLLLIAEAIASRDAVLNRSNEHSEARHHTFHNTTAVYDLLAIALVKRAQFNQLADSFEKALKFSFEEYHIWHQWANSLICAGQFGRAVAVLKECHRLKPKSGMAALQAAKVCYEHLHQYEEGINLCKLALESCGEEHPMSARVYVALGVGYSLKAMEMKLKADRQDFHRKALQAFQKAHVLDPSDYLSLFHLALQLAVLRQIEDAVKYTKLALKYYSDHVHSLHLLVLLLTAQKQYQEAMDLINAALEEYPDNVSLLLTKAKIEEIVYGPEKALNTCKNMMKLWKELQEFESEETSLVVIGSKKQSLTATDRSAFDRKSQAHLMLNEFSDRDAAGSVRADSVAVSRIEQTLSDLTSTEYSGSYPQRGGSRQAWKLQSQIWMNLCDLYLSLDRVKEAEMCVTETAAIFPLSHQVAFMKGRVYEHRQRYSEAKICYENAISINPSHTKSLQHLGMVLHCLDNNTSAEKVLRDAVNADPTLNESWYCLGVVLEALGHSESAAECQIMALDLEATSPIVPFTVIPRLMQ